MLTRQLKLLQSRLDTLPKRPIVIFSDLTCTFIALIYVLYLHTTINPKTPPSVVHYFLAFVFLMTTQYTCLWLFGLYRGLWRFASIPDLIRIIKACMVSTFILICANHYGFGNMILSFSSFPLFCILSICLLSGTRLTYRWAKDHRKIFKTGKKVLVIGAGIAGESILRELKRKIHLDYIPIGLIDDDPIKQGLEIQGIRVLGNLDQLNKVVREKAIDLIIIAIPTASAKQMRRIVNLCASTDVPYRTLPSFTDIATGSASINNIREVSLLDLLSRDPIQFNPLKLSNSLGNKKIIITGAGGSIGSELCRKIAGCYPKSMMLIEHSEFNLFQIQNELIQLFQDVIILPQLVSITNRKAIDTLMRDYQPDYVFHAAAYKHVPLLEPQTKVAVANNILGTQIVAEAAVRHGVKKFILVSTDKAVNPSNVMGATKRCAEIICQQLNKCHPTNFITVRFGNVLGSTGSVVPLFKQQIAKGGPVTVTHPDMERYFMTIEEAALLIIQTVTIENPNELYVLDMGEPVKIQYLAEQMIKLSGQRPNIDIKIDYCGLRPGEKINEELFYANENVTYSNQEKIMHVATPPINEAQYKYHLNALLAAYERDDPELKKYLFTLAELNKSEPETQPTVFEQLVLA